MFFNKKTLLAVFTSVAISGCVTTANTEQTEKITNLETSLDQSTILIQQTQSELDSAKKSLKANDEKISQLTNALEKSRAIVAANKSTKQTPDAEIKHIDDKTILGQAEWVYVSTVKENFKGRIDTGAATSSINAVDIERFERDGEKWVRFNLTHAKGEQDKIIETKIVRIAKIIQSSKPEADTERPVVKLHIRIGDVTHLTEFTLTDRLHMEYPVLIGRTFMQDVVLVDVSKEYIFPKYQAPAEK